MDSAAGRVRLVYLPLARSVLENAFPVENEVRTSLLKLLRESPALSAPKTMRLAASLSDDSMTLEGMYAAIKLSLIHI